MIILPDSTYFLALSHAPPVLEELMAICTAEAMEPASSPATASVPRKMPNSSGVSIAYGPPEYPRHVM